MGRTSKALQLLLLLVALSLAVMLQLEGRGSNRKPESNSILKSVANDIFNEVQMEPKQQQQQQQQSEPFNSMSYPAVEQWSQADWEKELERRSCVQDHLENTLGWKERGHLFFLRGCNNDAVINFDQWIGRSSCGTQPVIGELIFHVGWTGPWLEHFLEDMYALLDSFLATQDVHRSTLMFWLMDREPDENDPLIKRYTKLSNGKIVFRRVDTERLSEGTCLADPNNADMWDPPGDIQPQTKSDLLRLLLLYKFGGLWIDTDTILLQDMRPIFEFLGGFGGRFAMNQKYNNAMLGLRRGSPIGLDFLNMMCKFPKSVEPSALKSYCSVTGNPCNPQWWYNHNLLQWAARRGQIVAAPLHYFDPGNNCASRGLLSRSGSMVFSNWTAFDSLELVRGAYALHTRSYQAKERPLSSRSTFGQLFSWVKDVAHQRASINYVDQPAKLVPVGRRNTTEIERYKDLLSHLDSTPYPDPPFFPTAPATRVHVEAQLNDGTSACLAFDTKGGRRPYEKPMLHSCSKANHKKDERAVFLWHDSTKGPWKMANMCYLRPSFTRSSNVFCVGVTGSSDPQLRFQECDPSQVRQRWTGMSVGPGTFHLRNTGGSTGDGLCMSLPEYANSTEFPFDPIFRDCDHTATTAWRLTPARYTGDEATILT